MVNYEAEVKNDRSDSDGRNLGRGFVWLKGERVGEPMR